MTLYDFYGDPELVRENYPLMHDWLEWSVRQDEEHGGARLWNFGFHFGDWLAQDGVTPQSMKDGTLTVRFEVPFGCTADPVLPRLQPADGTSRNEAAV